MSPTIQIDLRAFERGITDYAAATGKELPDAITRQAGQLALHAGFHSPRGNRDSVAGLPDDKRGRDGRKNPADRGGKKATPWWPAFIQKVLNNGGFTLSLRRKAVGAERFKGYRDASTGKWNATQRTIGYKRLVAGAVGRDVKAADARRVSKKILARRMSTFGWLGAVFGAIAAEFGVTAGRRLPSGMRWAKWNKKHFWVSRQAQPGNLLAGFIIPFGGKRYAGDWPGGTRPNAAQSAQAKRGFALAALEASRDEVIRDMREHVRNILLFGRGYHKLPGFQPARRAA